MPRFVPRQRKHKVRNREANSAHDETSDTNQIQLIPATKSEKEEKRQKLKEELRFGQSKISSKKQKRLDKYIDKKLRKDEGLELVKKLEQAKVNTTGLQSSRHLGKRTFSEYAGLSQGNTIQENSTRSWNQEAVLDGDSEDSFEQDHVHAFSADDDFVEHQASITTVNEGSGLKQPLPVGDDGLPIIKVRHKRKKAKSQVVGQSSDDQIPWEGFETESDVPEEDEEEVDGDGLDIPLNSNLSGDEILTDEEEEEEDSDDIDSETSATSDNSSKEARSSAFKSWATQQINKSLGHIPSYADNGLRMHAPNLDAPTVSSSEQKTNGQKKPHPISTVLPKVGSSTPFSTEKTFVVPVTRPENIQEARMKLPIVVEEQKIMEAIQENPVVLIWGSTGSGKTTQVPQFLFEAGYGNSGSSTPGVIGVTQPRRVAAVSMAKRVAQELGSDGDKISYQVRFDSTVSSKTAIKFMTDGILLREVSQDVALSKYSVIVIDEAHERSINTDILIGMLSRIVSRRSKLIALNPQIKPLKLVIMSATLRTSDFLQNPRLFQPHPPLVQVEGRQYDVTIHFSRRTERDYVEEVFRKVSRGHRKLPRGAMLVFLTGQNEIKALRKRLLQAFLSTQIVESNAQVRLAANEAPLETEDFEISRPELDTDLQDPDEINIITESDNEDLWEEEGDPFELNEISLPESSVHVLPLYSQLPNKEQLRVFEPPPEGARLIVLATNVAETSLTIPGIRYVFDCGRVKERVYEQSTGIQHFEVNWISKASAEQRAGRAGRTEAGHCYRLYSSAVYERDFIQYTEPEILRTPIESVVLQLKTLHIDKVTNFPFPTSPSEESLRQAEKLLRNLGALSSDGRITTLGSRLGHYPISPRLGKILDIAVHDHPDLLSNTISLVAGLAVSDLFISQNQLSSSTDADDEEHSLRHAYNRSRSILSKAHPRSDMMKMLTAVLLYRTAEGREEFCERMFMQSKAMQEASQLEIQLLSVVRANNPSLVISTKPQALKSRETTLLSDILVAGYIDRIAIRADQAPNPPEMLRKPKRAIDVPYLPLIPLHSHASNLDEMAIYVHPSSVLAHLSPKAMPTYLVYSHLQQSQSSVINSEEAFTKIRMFPLTPVTGDQLLRLARDTPLLEYSKPVGHKISSLGGVPERRECWVIPYLVGQAGAVGWPLPAQKVMQKKDPKLGWIIESLVS